MLAMMEFALSLCQGSGRILKMVTGGAHSLSLPADSCPVSSEDIKSTVRIFVASFFSSAVIASCGSGAGVHPATCFLLIPMLDCTI